MGKDLMNIGIKFLFDEDIINYKKTSMFIGLPNCSFKCGRDNCQNASLAAEPNILISISNLIERYLKNPITEAIVFGGLEPFDSWEEIKTFIKEFRNFSSDDVIIYSGYNEDEIPQHIIEWLKTMGAEGRIIVKYGRFIPSSDRYYNDILGVTLASKNQIVKIYE